MDDLQIKEGITDSQIDQLVAYTNSDEDIKRLTADYRRFLTKNMADNWLKEIKPIIYTLSDNNEKLKGIIWFTKLELIKDDYTEKFEPKEYQLTFAIRLYDNARGKGLAQKFFKDCFNKLKTTKYYKDIDNKGLWLSTYVDNLPAINLYKKLGFIQVNNPERIKRVIMILK